MIVAALRDLVWRRRRFAIAIVAAALVFGMSLLMSGLADSFPNEVDRLLDRLGGESYLAAEGEPGPFTTTKLLPVDAAPGMAPFIMTGTATRVDGDLRDVTLIGLPVGRSVGVRDGTETAAPGEAVVDRALGVDLGATLTVGGVQFRVVGRTTRTTIFGGQPVAFVPIQDLQGLVAAGQPITRAWIVEDAANASAPPGLERFDRDAAAEDLLRPLQGANRSISFVKALLWLVAACIIGSVVFLSALERVRDFAIFKATGVATKSIAVGLALQAVILAVASSIVSVGVALLLGPAFPMPIEIPMSAYVSLPLLAIVIGLAASIAGMRRAVTIDPALAFGGR